MTNWSQQGWRFGAILILCAACSSQPASVATVGQVEIGRQDVTYTIGVARAYGNTNMSDTAAVVSLINSALEGETGRLHGVLVTEAEIDDFSRYVDESSKAPEVLAKVKAVFGSDADAYRRLFLAPKVVSIDLREWFYRDAGVQAAPRRAIEHAWTLVHAGRSFKEGANVAGLSYSEQRYVTASKKAPDSLKPFFPDGLESMPSAFRKILDGLEPGQITSSIIENEYTYRIIRLLEKSEEEFRTEEVIASKQAFDPWYREQASLIPVMIHDEAVLNQVCARYPKLWWSAGMCRNG